MLVFDRFGFLFFASSEVDCPRNWQEGVIDKEETMCWLTSGSASTTAPFSAAASASERSPLSDLDPSTIICKTPSQVASPSHPCLSETVWHSGRDDNDSFDTKEHVECRCPTPISAFVPSHTRTNKGLEEELQYFVGAIIEIVSVGQAVTLQVQKPTVADLVAVALYSGQDRRRWAQVLETK